MPDTSLLQTSRLGPTSAINKRKVLFLAWDGPFVNYMDGLFFPIFERLVKQYGYEFHVIHFSWASHSKISKIEETASASGLKYTFMRVYTKPIAAIGKLWTTWRGIRLIRDYVVANHIDILLPRSTMPAKMALSVHKKLPSLKIVFDADGLPIEERVDFAGLDPKSFRFKHLKRIEERIITKSKAVLTRTVLAAEHLASQYRVDQRKFFQVVNGRDEQLFRPNTTRRHSAREHLGIATDSLVVAYCGSIGPQYGIEQMLYIFEGVLKLVQDTYLLIVTNNPQRLETLLIGKARDRIIIKQAEIEEVPALLSAADFGFAIRKSHFSMIGVSPIKLGEYLLMGLPVIASAKIGDTDKTLYDKTFAFILDSFETVELDKAVAWIVKGRPDKITSREVVRNFALENYSLEKSANSYDLALRSVL